MDKNVTDRDIRDIAMNTDLLHKDLMKLFMELDMKQSDIENAERNADTTDVQLRAVHVLLDWRKHNGQSATRRKILEALRKCKLVVAKEMLEEIWSAWIEIGKFKASWSSVSGAREKKIPTAAIWKTSLRGV